MTDTIDTARCRECGNKETPNWKTPMPEMENGLIKMANDTSMCPACYCGIGDRVAHFFITTMSRYPGKGDK